MRYLDGDLGLLALVVFGGLLVWAAVATRRHDRQQELDAYAALDPMNDDRLTGAPW